MEAEATMIDESSLRIAWDAVLENLRKTIGADSYERWFASTSALGVADGTLNIGVPNPIHEFWIESNFGNQLTAAIEQGFGTPLGHTFEVVELAKEVPAPEIKAMPSEPSKRAEEVVEDLDRPAKKQRTGGDSTAKVGLNADYTFQEFVVGPNCKFAFAAAQAAVDRPGQAFNPILIHGRTGLGKTHLMQAIGHACVERGVGSRVIYMTSEQFTNEFIMGIRRGDGERLRRKYRKAEVLLIDDIQFFAGKDSTQEEFFHTFNVLFDAKKQIVLTSDRPPGDIKELEHRLISRFESGLTTELLPPDAETREAILRAKMQNMDVAIDDGLIKYLARRIRSNVRRLEGALIRLVSMNSLGVRDLDEPAADEILWDILKEETGKTLNIEQIQRCVADYFDIRLADMSSRRRPKHIAQPRQVAMYLARDITKSPLKEVGRAFGGRDHGTVIHACRTVEKRVEEEDEFRQEVSRIRAILEREAS